MTQKSDEEQKPEVEAAEEDYLLPGPVREAHIAGHPFTKDKQLLQTPGTTAMYHAVLRCVRRRDRGYAVYCPSTGGKSRAINVLIAMFRKAHPHVVVLKTQAIDHGQPSENALWLDILTSQQAKVGRAAAAMRATLVKLLTAATDVHGGEEIVLFVDEAQEWPAEHWRFMKGLVNTLQESYDIWMLVVPVGQTPLIRVREDIKELEEQGEDLMTRFMNDLQPLLPLRSKDDVVAILSQFDSPAFNVYPAGSACCYSKFFLPQAYANGWRLAAQANHIWAALSQIKRNKRMPSMRHLMGLVREFLLNAQDAPDFRAGKAAWMTALQATSYANRAD